MSILKLSQLSANVNKESLHTLRFHLLERYDASHYNILTTAHIRPATLPNLGRTIGPTPPEEVADAEEEAVERAAVESSVEDAELLIPDELGDPLGVEEAEELDPEPGNVELTLTMLPIDPLVAVSIADIDAGIGLGLGVGLDIGIVVATENE
jgi:hypothetical protein